MPRIVVTGGAGPGGVKAVAPTGIEPITITIPEPETRVSILGEKLTVERIDGTATYSTSGRPIAIVSNNSRAAIAEYLAQHDLSRMITAIAGRPVARPELMKPDPYSLLAAVDMLNVQASQAVLVGDSTTDIEAANCAKMLSIGFANKPHKLEHLSSAGATSIIEGSGGMAELVKAYAARLP